MKGTNILSRLSIIAVTAGLAATAGAGPINSPEDVAQITAIEAALAGETDVDKALVHYAPDAVMATIAAPGWYEGTGQIRAALVSRLSALRSIAVHTDEINIASDGYLACAAMVVRREAVGNDGTSQSTAVRQLDALKKIDGQWRIVQQQISVPVDVATGAPILNGPLGVKGPLGWSAVPAPNGVQAPAEARADIRKWLESNIIPLTADGAMETYGPSDDLILFDVASPVEHRGRAEMRQYFGSVLNGIRNFEYRIPAFTVDTDGSFAVQISYLDLKPNMVSGPPQYISFRQSDCLRRIGDRWFPFFEMGSFPIDPQTGKAIMARPEVFK